MNKTKPEEHNGWTKGQLEAILNEAIAVELFTIPVYLSAANSIKKENRGDKVVPITVHDDNGGTKTEMFAPYDVIMSVAVQEMYHFTMACNLANALGVRPTITAPDLNNPPTCIPLGNNPKTRGTLSELLPTMLAIEAADSHYSYNEDPENPYATDGPTQYQKSYDSIGDMYHALGYAVQGWFDTLYTVENNNYQRTNFSDKYKDVMQVISTLEDALNVIACIVEQGEGNDAHGFMPDAYVPTIPTAQFHDLDEVSHWERFNAMNEYLLKNPNGVPQYTSKKGAGVAEDKQLSIDYSRLINQLAEDFSHPGSNVNLRGMAETGTLATNVWIAGGTPSWNYIPEPGTWTVPLELHVCQGLNMCAGHGANGSGSMPGNGDCATVSHGCQYTNDCRGQGACGYPGKTKNGGTDAYTPGQNACAGMGGCQAPISPQQTYPTASDNPNSGKKVWDVARTLFEARCQDLGVNYDTTTITPSAARNAVQPTNPGS